jgi:hypothetical protein
MFEIASQLKHQQMLQVYCHTACWSAGTRVFARNHNSAVGRVCSSSIVQRLTCGLCSVSSVVSAVADYEGKAAAATIALYSVSPAAD